MLSALKLSLKTNINWYTKNIRLINFDWDTQRQMEQNENYKKENIDLHVLMRNLREKSNFNSAYTTIQILALYGKETYKTIEASEQFYILNDLLRKSSHAPSVVIRAALQHMKTLQFPDDCETVQCLENSLLKPDLNPTELRMLYSFFKYRNGTNTQKLMLERIRMKIEELSSGITYLPDILFLYKHYSEFSTSLLASLDELILKKCASLNIRDLSAITVALSRSNRRNPKLLHDLTSSLLINCEDMEMKDCINVFYALCILNYFNKDLMSKLSIILVNNIDHMKNPTQIGALLISVGMSRYRQEALLDNLSEWIEKNFENCRLKDLSSYTTTMAIVNYVPDNFDKVNTLILPLLSTVLTEDTSMFIRYVWSLVVLKKANKDLISSILKRTVYDSLPKPIESNFAVYEKLLNINSAAKLMNDCQEFLDEDIVKKILIALKKCSPIQNKNGITIMENLYSDGNVVGNVLTPMGFPIGAELILDAKNIPLLLENYDSYSSTKIEAVELPHGARRIAVMFWNFKHYCYNSTSLNGQAMLYKDLLAANGYTVLEVPYYELEKINTKLQHIQIVKEKINCL